MHTPSPKTPRLLKASCQTQLVPRNSPHSITPASLLAFVVLAILVGVLSAFSSNAVAQSEEDDAQPIVSRAIAATVDYGNENIFNPAKHATDFDRLGVLAEQLLTITVQFPPELAGQIVLVDALDGGGVNVPEEGLTINLDGDVTFKFQTSVAFGACRLTVHQPDDSNFLQFWIVDPEHPENTPPDLPGVY